MKRFSVSLGVYRNASQNHLEGNYTPEREGGGRRGEKREMKNRKRKWAQEEERQGN